MYRPTYIFQVEARREGFDVVRSIAEGSGGLVLISYPTEEHAQALADFLSYTEEDLQTSEED